MSGVLYFFLRTLLGSEGVMQRLHFLVGFLQQSVYQFNACMQFHTCAPWPVFFHHGKVYRRGGLICSPGGGGNYPQRRGTRPCWRTYCHATELRLLLRILLVPGPSMMAYARH